MNPLTAIYKIDKAAFHKVRHAYQKRRKTFPVALMPVPQEELDGIVADKMQYSPPCKVWRSQRFLAQLFKEGPRYRLSVNRCDINSDGSWKGDITWDELMECKRQCGYGDYWAVEVYPPDEQVVNVANIRHLWLVEQPPEYAWKKNL